MAHYILCDIEGTTTSISFVHETLFPYAAARIGDFVREQWESEDLADAIEGVRETLKEEDGLENADQDAVVAALERWIAEDRKHTALKDIQGILWRHGYTAGDFQGHIYPDVPEAFDRWKQAGIDLGVYSSGSVEAQKLLFGHSEAGDLSEYFSHFFDTRTGHKREAASYAAISKAIGLPAGEILFLSDVAEELDAAEEAGMQAIQLLRPGTAASGRHAAALDFSEIIPRSTLPSAS